MTQKKPNAGVRPVKGVSKRGWVNPLWQNKRRGQVGWIALIAAIGVLVVLAAYQLESGSFLNGSAAANGADSGIHISEFMAENVSTLITAAGDAPDWVEIENSGSESVNLSGYKLFLNSDIKKLYAFGNVTLAPGEYTLVYAEGSQAPLSADAQAARFSLSPSGGDTLMLVNASDSVLDAVEMPQLSANESYARTGDGSWAVTTRATPGARNDDAAAQEAEGETEIDVHIIPGALELSEVMADNTLYFADEYGLYWDYAEIHNTSGQGVNLEGWYLSDAAGKLKKWAFPAVTIPANGYLAVHLSGQSRTEDVNHLHASFKLSSEGESIYLSDPDGRTVSMVTTPALETDQPYSLLDGEWTTIVPPTPGMENSYEAAAQVNAQRFGQNALGVYITEIVASATEQNYDWIELYNAGGAAVDLSGYGLSDSAGRPRKWQFPAGTTIEAGQYLGVFCSGTDVSDISGYLNANFALSKDGGYTVCLATPQGDIFDGAYLPQQYGGIAYGRIDGQNGFFYLPTPTPGSANGASGYRAKADSAQYSVPGGLFTTGESFTVELSAPAGSRIYYTLDSSDPDEGDTLYTAPIPISATTVLRTRVYRDGYLESYMDTQSYLYDVNNPDGLMVISLVSDPYGLTSDESGIMVKGPNATATFPFGSMNSGANFWMDWERESHLEMYSAQGEQLLSQECGIKLHGQYSRAINVKAFKVIARSEYGANRFDYPIFPARDYTQYQSFVLRTSGQDYNKSFMRDSVFTALANGTSLDYQETALAICYLDGQYYSLYNIRERINTTSICQFEGWEGMEDDIDLVKANSNVMQGSNQSFEELLNYVKNNDTTTDAAFQYIDSMIDVQNYIEYMAVEIFTGNTDTLNIKRYRNGKTDGKWRWVLFDLDWAFTTDTDSIGRWLTPGGMGNGNRTDNTLFIACMKNPTFRERFLIYFGQQMATTFTTENVLAKCEERYNAIKGSLPDYWVRWDMTESGYNTAMQELIAYAKARPTKLLGYFKETFNFSDADMQKYFGEAIAKIQATNG